MDHIFRNLSLKKSMSTGDLMRHHMDVREKHGIPDIMSCVPVFHSFVRILEVIRRRQSESHAKHAQKNIIHKRKNPEINSNSNKSYDQPHQEYDAGNAVPSAIPIHDTISCQENQEKGNAWKKNKWNEKIAVNCSNAWRKNECNESKKKLQECMENE
jgi:hypothetical protein